MTLDNLFSSNSRPRRNMRRRNSDHLPLSRRPSDSKLTSNRFKPSKLVVFLGLIVTSFFTYLYFVPPASNRILTPPSPDLESNGDIIVLEPGLTADKPKQEAVVEAFKHAWLSYETDAFGFDEYHPVSHRGENIVDAGGVGYTVADAVDTMYLMGLKDEYKRAREWIKTSMTFDRDGTFSTFETTIRVLGGLLSTYHLTEDQLFLDRAVDLADRLLTAFDTSSGMPLPSVNLGQKVGVVDRFSPDTISTAEATTLQLEFRYLAQLTGKTEYWYKTENVMSILDKLKKPYNLIPIYMSVARADFMHADIRLGSRGDSYYEYLLKQYLQTNRSEDIYNRMYQEAMQGVHDQLIQETLTKHMIYIAELVPRGTVDGETTYGKQAKQDHLVCFLAGSLMLGATTSGSLNGTVSVPPRMEELSSRGKRDWETGTSLLETCMYTHDTSTGLSPEIVQFKTQEGMGQPDRDWYIKNSRKGGPSSYDARYMLRPETVESLFIAWRLTGDVKYRNYSWEIFSSIEKYCRLSAGGYATVLDVDTVPVTHDDKQETFFLSETLKYLYLTFSDFNVLPLDKYVFNTEAHPLPIFNPSIEPHIH